MLTSTALANQKSELLEILVKKSVKRGSFTLSSGATSDLYVNCKLTALDPQAALLVGAIGWELLKGTAAEMNLRVNAVGGLTMGADPISLSIGIAAQLDQPGNPLQTFTVRKTAKEHGLRKRIEGNFVEGDTVVVVDDVVTTGGSTIQAIEAVEAEGGKVAFVIVLVDRQEGGRENIERRGYKVVPFFTRADVLAERKPQPAFA
jgi:orotate phosphoribosyltransferase